MRTTLILILTFIFIATHGQGLSGKYNDYFGHTLVLNKDSTFRFDWSFDLVHDWATGKWTASGKTIKLKFIDVYDTLSRPNKPDSLVLSTDEASNKITDEEFVQTLLISGGQYRDRFRSDKFYQRGKRLYIINKDGRLNKSRHGGIWPQKKWSWGYKKWPTWYMKAD